MQVFPYYRQLKAALKAGVCIHTPTHCESKPMPLLLFYPAHRLFYDPNLPAELRSFDQLLRRGLMYAANDYHVMWREGGFYRQFFHQYLK